MSQPESVRRAAAVLIVDDHAPMREAMRVCIERAFPNLPVIEAPDGATALEVVKENCPCLVLMDINLPDANGLDLTRDILKQWPRTFVVVISIDTSMELSEYAKAAGALELIGKDDLFRTLLPLVGAAVTLNNMMKGLTSLTEGMAQSPQYGSQHAAHLVRTDVLPAGQA